MYAIRNKRTKKWLYGTDYRYSPPHQRTSKNKVCVFEDYKTAELEFKFRGCGNDYEIALIKIEAEE